MFKQVGSALKHQARNVLFLATGRPVSPTPISSMTLDADDVALAKDLLSHKDSWLDKKSVHIFEQAFCDFTGADEAASFNAGRIALSAILSSLEIQHGDEVVVPGYTCVVVPNAVTTAKAIPVYCDIELDTYGLDINCLKQRVSSRTKVIILQHLYGLVCRDFEAILEFARKRGIAIIEDCAHATGASYRGVKVGLHGDAGFYSCEQSKVFNSTCGGVAVSRRSDLMQRIRSFQSNASWPSEHQIESALKTVILNHYRFKHSDRWWRGDLALMKYGDWAYVSTTPAEVSQNTGVPGQVRMSGAVAVIARNQILKTAAYNNKRIKNAQAWSEWCQERSVRQPMIIDESEPIFLRYPVLMDTQYKRSPYTMLKHHGILPGDWFRSHLHPASIKLDDCPNAQIAVEQCINLPCLNDDD